MVVGPAADLVEEAAVVVADEVASLVSLVVVPRRKANNDLKEVGVPTMADLMVIVLTTTQSVVVAGVAALAVHKAKVTSNVADQVKAVRDAVAPEVGVDFARQHPGSLSLIQHRLISS